MPCELVPRTVNSRHVAVELEVNGAEKITMYKERLDRGKSVQLSDGFVVDRERQYRQTHQQGGRQDSLEGSDEKHNSKTSQQEIPYHAFGYKTPSRIFATLEDFGVIHETTEPNTDESVTVDWYSVPPRQQNRISRRKSATTSMSKTRQDKVRLLGVSPPEINRRLDSKKRFLYSARGAFGSDQYQNDSDFIFGEQSSERKDGNDLGVSGELALVSNTTRRSTYTAMNALPEALIDSRRLYSSLPRNFSIPVENHRAAAYRNGKRQRNSIPMSSDCSTGGFVFDNDTDAQWEKLVERARNFQKLPTKTPVKMVNSKVEKIHIGNIGMGLAGCVREGFEKHSRNSEENEKKESPGFVDITQPPVSQEQQTLSKNNMEDDTTSSDEIKTKDHSSISSREKGVPKSGQVEKYIPINSTVDSKPQMNKSSRRYSLATVRPTPEVRERISGYSTHGALEYARMLLGKIQTEGKSKSKKERLDEVSKALKMVLEELNRIDVPDRELVSLFISLRAKIVNLKDDLKADENVITCDNETEKNVAALSKTLTTKVRNTLDKDEPPAAYVRRRFSWC